MKARRRYGAGFTLLELMLTVGIIGVMAAITVPSMRVFIWNGRLTGVSNDLLRSVQVARSEAIKRQQRVVVCAVSDPQATTPTCSNGELTGWVSFSDPNNNAAIDTGETIIERYPLVDPTVTIMNDGEGIFSYIATGFSNAPSGKTLSQEIVICDQRGKSVARAMRLTATGRARISKDTTDVDAAIAAASASTACP